MNSQDPLEQLRDIHLPETAGWWPLAWGWWLAIAVALVLGALLLHGWLKRRRQRRYRYDALQALDQAYAQYRIQEDTASYLQQVSELLRRAVLSGTSPAQGATLAALSGEQWLAFLDRTLPGGSNDFQKGPGRALLAGPYQPNPEADIERLQTLARQWLLEHRIEGAARDA